MVTLKVSSTSPCTGEIIRRICVTAIVDKHIRISIAQGKHQEKNHGYICKHLAELTVLVQICGGSMANMNIEVILE